MDLSETIQDEFSTGVTRLLDSHDVYGKLWRHDRLRLELISTASRHLYSGVGGKTERRFVLREIPRY